MNAALAKVPAPQIESGAIEQVLAYGDLTKLSSSQRTAYYTRVCESLGLNPLTRPFEFINLSGKLVFYARRDCTDQLRSIHAVTVSIVGRERIDDVYVVTARAQLPNGRADESTGAVALGNLKGEALANALMKAETKAKRRVTLSICGLSVLDESELDTVRDARPVPIEQQPPRIAPNQDADDFVPAGDSATVFEEFANRLATIEDSLPGCESYDGVLVLREMLGSKAKPSRLNKEIQAASERNALDATQRKELAKTWHRCSRVLDKLEAKYPPPDALESFVDLPEDYEGNER